MGGDAQVHTSKHDGSARRSRPTLSCRSPQVFLLALLCSTSCLFVCRGQLSAAPTTSPSKASKAAVDAAIDPLRQEFIAFRRDPKAFPLRTACDALAETKPPGLTADAVLSTLAQRLDPDPRVAAYVRWQLLSALPKELAPADVPRGLDLYRSAPAPAARFGLSTKEQQSLDALLPTVRKTDDVVLTSRLEAAVRAWAEQNRHLIAYRDEWYRRLPKAAPTFVAAFEDAYQRQNLAAGAEDFAPIVIADVQNWLVTGTDAGPAACAALAGVLARLRERPAPPYYASAAVRSGRLTWVRQTDSMDPRKKLTLLHQALVEAAQKPPTKKPVTK